MIYKWKYEPTLLQYRLYVNNKPTWCVFNPSLYERWLFSKNDHPNMEFRKRATEYSLSLEHAKTAWGLMHHYGLSNGPETFKVVDDLWKMLNEACQWKLYES